MVPRCSLLCMIAGMTGKQALCESTTTDLHREVSSYPNRSSRTRRSERDVEAAELEKTSMTSVKDEDCSTPRKKLRLSKEQISILEGSFKAQTTVNPVYNISTVNFRYTISSSAV